jgi:hypothetical protein
MIALGALVRDDPNAPWRSLSVPKSAYGRPWRRWALGAYAQPLGGYTGFECPYSLWKSDPYDLWGADLLGHYKTIIALSLEEADRIALKLLANESGLYDTGNAPPLSCKLVTGLWQKKYEDTWELHDDKHVLVASVTQRSDGTWFYRAWPMRNKAGLVAVAACGDAEEAKQIVDQVLDRFGWVGSILSTPPDVRRVLSEWERFAAEQDLPRPR